MRRLLSYIMVVLVVASSGFAYYFYTELKQAREGGGAASAQETKQLVASIGELIKLPEGEDPTIATVSDPEKLKGQPFFANAKVGYKVLIYTKARKAILYDPASKKIIDVAPINIGSGELSPSP